MDKEKLLLNITVPVVPRRWGKLTGSQNAKNSIKHRTSIGSSFHPWSKRGVVIFYPMTRADIHIHKCQRLRRNDSSRTFWLNYKPTNFYSIVSRFEWFILLRNQITLYLSRTGFYDAKQTSQIKTKFNIILKLGTKEKRPNNNVINNCNCFTILFVFACCGVKPLLIGLRLTCKINTPSEILQLI